MTALLGDQIRAAMEREVLSERLIVAPLLDAKKQIGSGSVDLRLGTEFLELSRAGQTLLDAFAGNENRTAAFAEEKRTFVPLGDGIVLHPGQFILGSTLEFLSLPADINGQVVSRSSWGRLGLLVSTAVAVHPGYKGVLTLELVNTGSVPIMLRAGARVAQLQLWGAVAPTGEPYGSSGAYRIPVGPESARLGGEKSEGAKLFATHADLFRVRQRVVEDSVEGSDSPPFQTGL